jgi:hypothetical protein
MALTPPIVRSQLAHRIEDRVVQAGRFLRRAQALLVGLYIGKVQRVGRAQAAVHQLIAGLQQQRDPLPGANLEVVLALGADVQVGFEVRLPDGLPAAQALGPQALGAHLSFAGVGTTPIAARARLVFAVFALEPGHPKPLLNQVMANS